MIYEYIKDFDDASAELTPEEFDKAETEFNESYAQYQAMLAEIRILEKKYDAVLQTLSGEHRDIICDYVSLCEEMSWRMLEFACEQMKPPGA